MSGIAPADPVFKNVVGSVGEVEEEMKGEKAILEKGWGKPKQIYVHSTYLLQLVFVYPLDFYV